MTRPTRTASRQAFLSHTGILLHASRTPGSIVVRLPITLFSCMSLTHCASAHPPVLHCIDRMDVPHNDGRSTLNHLLSSGKGALQGSASNTAGQLFLTASKTLLLNSLPTSTDILITKSGAVSQDV
jgi:hypothetical protein